MISNALCGDDDAGWAEYHAQMFPPSPMSPPDSWLRFKMNSAGLNVARQLAAARNRGIAAWTVEHGEVGDWPLAHPPTVLWMPYMAYGGCFGCSWLDCPHADDVGRAAVLARRHAAATGTELSLMNMPLIVWRRSGA